MSFRKIQGFFMKINISKNNEFKQKIKNNTYSFKIDSYLSIHELLNTKLSNFSTIPLSNTFKNNETFTNRNYQHIQCSSKENTHNKMVCDETYAPINSTETRFEFSNFHIYKKIISKTFSHFTLK